MSNTYLVGVREVHTIYVEVEADCVQEALILAGEKIMEEDYPDIQYDYTLPKEEWTVNGRSID